MLTHAVTCVAQLQTRSKTGLSTLQAGCKGRLVPGTKQFCWHHSLVARESMATQTRGPATGADSPTHATAEQERLSRVPFCTGHCSPPLVAGMMTMNSRCWYPPPPQVTVPQLLHSDQMPVQFTATSLDVGVQSQTRSSTGLCGLQAAARIELPGE
jgi:hypothetical protein